MADEAELKFVRFDIWCEQCRHKDIPENETPCDECLEHGANEGSEKPVKFEAK